MPETILRVSLAEMTVLRVRCLRPTCGGVAEVPVAGVASSFNRFACPLCNCEFDDSQWQGEHLLRIFAEAVKRLNQLRDRVAIEFHVPATPAPPSRPTTP